MNVKSILIGAGLVIVGAILGVVLSTHCCPKQGEKMCGKDQQNQTNCHNSMGKEHGEMRGDMFHEELSKKLNLTPEQQTKVNAIFDAKREQMHVEMQKTHEAIKALLTDEQKKQFDAMIAERCPMGKMDGNKPCCKKPMEGCQKMK